MTIQSRKLIICNCHTSIIYLFHTSILILFFPLLFPLLLMFLIFIRYPNVFDDSAYFIQLNLFKLRPDQILAIMQRGYSPSPKPAFRNTRSKFFKKKQSDISKAPSPSHQQSTGDFWKNKGNDAFSKGYYQTAIEHYTKAIELNDGESIYYSNRAKCYRNLNMIDRALKDAESACQLDDKNIKAHYLCGCILAQASKKDDSKIVKAQNRLKKALRLCDTLKKTEFVDSISIKLFRLRKLKYLKQEEAIAQHNKKIINLIKKSYVQGLINKQQQDKLIKMEESLKKTKTKQIPDHMLCKITLEVMQDPVATDAGFTYQKSAIEDHFHTNGMIQPITRQPLNGKMYPNQALKLAIQSFMEQNPWAFQFTSGQSYSDITF